MAELNKKIDNFLKTVNKMKSRNKKQWNIEDEKDESDYCKEEENKGLPSARYKIVMEAGTKKGLFLVKDYAKEDIKDPQECSYIAEYIEQSVVKLNFSLGIIDGVYPTT